MLLRRDEGDMLYAYTERIAHMKSYGYDFKYYV